MRAIVFYMAISSIILYSIIPSAQSINIGYEWKSTGSITVDVSPDNLQTTATIVNTGDGIFITLLQGATATSDFTLEVRSSLENTGSPRTCKVVISDNSGKAAPTEITIHQAAAPI